MMEEALQLEINQLRKELANVTAERDRLNEECDLLAEENERLRSKLAEGGSSSLITTSKVESASRSMPTETIPEELEVFLEDPGKPFANHLQRQIPNASSGKNVICTAFYINPDLGEILFCGGVDATLRGYDTLTGIELYSIKGSAPILTIDCSDQCIACGMMDGSLLLVYIISPDSEPVVINHKDHTKYCICLKWSNDGKYLATAGHDKVVNLYQNQSGELIKYQSLQFNHTPESLVFTIPTIATILPELILGLRGICYLIYLNLETFEQRHISLNEKDWDTHVSFTPLYLSLSPNQKYLLIATDKHMHFIVKVGTNQRVRVLTGHTCGDYGKPVALWDPSGQYIYCNSEEEHTLYVYSVSRQKVVEKLSGHHGIIRGLAVHPIKGTVATASYDKSMILWDHH